MKVYKIQILGTFITREFQAASEKEAKALGRDWGLTIHKNLKTRIIKISNL